ncbi:alpha/beta fold hydrolase [Streptomyces sp. NPDC087297]|uniref:alpha/beta fold hydrolase n=1 Tax=Streptomyces sp. NPDC087297 TaxID=3365778 RepID=UPI003802353A
MQPTFVLVHGAFANSFSFAPLQAELGLLGHRSVAVDLPGHGFQATFTRAYQAPQDLEGLATAPGSIKGVTLADNAAHLIGILERAKRNGPVILVSHSRGGITATAAANARPDLIDRIVYVSAWCPVRLDVGDYYAEPEMAGVDPTAFASALAGNPCRARPAPRQLPHREPGLARGVQGGLLRRRHRRAVPDLPEHLPAGREPGRRRLRRPGAGRHLGPYPEDLHPSGRRREPAPRPAGPADPRGQRADAGQPLRRAHPGGQPPEVAGRPGAGGPRAGRPRHAPGPVRSGVTGTW